MAVLLNTKIRTANVLKSDPSDPFKPTLSWFWSHRRHATAIQSWTKRRRIWFNAIDADENVLWDKVDLRFRLNLVGFQYVFHGLHWVCPSARWWSYFPARLGCNRVCCLQHQNVMNTKMDFQPNQSSPAASLSCSRSGFTGHEFCPSKCLELNAMICSSMTSFGNWCWSADVREKMENNFTLSIEHMGDMGVQSPTHPLPLSFFCQKVWGLTWFDQFSTDPFPIYGLIMFDMNMWTVWSRTWWDMLGHLFGLIGLLSLPYLRLPAGAWRSPRWGQRTVALQSVGFLRSCSVHIFGHIAAYWYSFFCS